MRNKIYFLLLLLVVGCNKSPRAIVTPSSATVLLDSLLSAEGVPGRIKEAEENQPSDVWKVGLESRPGRYNVSRDSRESALAQELLRPFASRLARMPARELLDSLKTVPASISTNFSGVAYYVYRDGNHEILKELASRPKSELETLRVLETDRRVVFTGDAGGYSTVGELIRVALLNDIR